ncbi:LexA family protein [Natronincola ferrireducens]|uniref:LexA family protein n=1 Tax=Natronincola ferrireducens TaxID=393762 RepID=UPI0015A0E2DE|nr:hypothetical protein [Natronincola ferrireducens]
MKGEQIEILKAIEKFIRDNGFYPTIWEICRLVNVKSTRGVHMYLKRLGELGIVENQGALLGTMKITKKGRDVIKAYEIIG